jgi:predicted ArsR family transcriptional regulator
MTMAERRQAVMDTLRSSGSPMSIVEIARRLRVHPNTVRFHLQVLARDGRVERVEPTRSTPGRPPLMFQAHRGMNPSGPRNYQLLADALATSMSADVDGADKAIESGRAWGSRLVEASSEQPTRDVDQATDRLVKILDHVGFSPERRTSTAESQIGLNHCPFLDLVPKHESVICPLHLGLMQGALTAMGAGITITRLEPFVEPDLCLAHVGQAGAAS